MFGYVRVDKGELKVREFEAYRGMYCSLCRALSKRYGVLSRLILSYDATFLAIVRFSQAQILPSFRPGRCPFNPAKRCSYCTNGEEAFDFVCAAAVLMFYYKVRDDLSDEGFFRRLLMLLLLPVAALWRKKAKKRFSNVDVLLGQAMAAQAAAEKEGVASFDKAAHACADALGKLFAFETDDENRALYRFGYAVGRWVYLADAVDDLKKDLRRGRYNVFACSFALTDATLSEPQKNAILETLNASIGLALDSFDQTNCKIMTPIIENILTGGLSQTTARLLKGDETDERSL
ncbi:MAG: hypothetical protein IJU56_06070 [Clostridia bacterium]|nr:hypothetical protein [Clostridia bacterium]